MGALSPGSKPASNGRYKLTGITELAEFVRIHKLLDRGWPDYNYPAPLTGEMMDQYRAFLNWQHEQHGMCVERFQPGRADQIVLLRQPVKYPDFQVRNLAANGEVWTGVATSTRHHFPPAGSLRDADLPSENMCSAAIRVSYGKFDYFTGGDLTSFKDDFDPQWREIDRPVALAAGPVDVYVLNHHGYYDSNSAASLSLLRPRVLVLPIFSAAQPDRRVLRRILWPNVYPGPRDLFATAFSGAARTVYADWIDKLKSLEGHIVVRVSTGGDRYRVFVVDNKTENGAILSAHGPYESR